MKISANLDLNCEQEPDPWDDSWGVQMPLNHIICRDLNGTPYSIRDFIWPWTAYTKDNGRFLLHFYYWNQKLGPNQLDRLEVSPEREARIREIQFLMTRQLYYGNENSPRTLESKLYTLHHVARFAEARSCTVRDVLTDATLLDACNASIPNFLTTNWIAWINLLRNLNPATQLGFTLAKPNEWRSLLIRVREWRKSQRQFAPLPTKIYGELINNLSKELDDIEAHLPRLLATLRDALGEHARAKALHSGNDFSVGPELIKKHGLEDYLARRGFNLRKRALATLSGSVTEIFLVCQLQIHLFSGMRREEVRTLPYHCMDTKTGHHGRTHSLITGVTSKLNKGRSLRTHWVTTDRDGFRAIRLAQQLASIIYKSIGIVPCPTEARKDEFPLFPTTDYFPWGTTKKMPEERILKTEKKLSKAKEPLRARLFPLIEEEDIAELEEIDPFRVWRDEKEFSIGQRWSLTTHQLRRSLAIYANSSGLVRLSSLRRQLQHITHEMSLYYGRGSTFCKNFITNDPDGYRKHVAHDWQDGEAESKVLAFTREVLNSKESMFGGAGNFYQRQKERGKLMSREEVATRMKGGLLSYQPVPLGGCTKLGGCDQRKGLALIDISCATDNCKNLVGKHSKVIKVIQLKRMAMAHIVRGSIEEIIEMEELDALERIERSWRPTSSPLGSQQE